MSLNLMQCKDQFPNFRKALLSLKEENGLTSRIGFWIALAIANFAMVTWIYLKIHLKIDFEAFYAVGHALLVNPHHVYDPMVQLRDGGIWHSESELLPYYHLPVELIVFGPLAMLSYVASLWVWRFVTVVVLFVSAKLLSEVLQTSTLRCFAVFMAFVPAILCLGEGQDSILLLLLLTVTYYLLRQDRQVLAGIVLAFALFKPQIVCIFALALLISRRTRFFVSFVVTSIVALGFCTLYLSPTWIPEILALIRWQESREAPARMISLHGFLALHGSTGDGVLWIILSVLLMGGWMWCWNKCRDLEFVVGSAVLVGSLLAFHIHIYDASVFLLPIAILFKIGMSEWDRYALVPFFVTPLVFFLMANHFTGSFAIGTSIFLYSYWKFGRYYKNENGASAGHPFREVLNSPVAD
jgi:hypothetical protein